MWQLGLPAYSAAIMFPGSLVVCVYWVVVRFLAIELTLRPFLEDIACDYDGWDDRHAIPLKGKEEDVRLFAPPAAGA